MMMARRRGGGSGSGSGSRAMVAVAACCSPLLLSALGSVSVRQRAGRGVYEWACLIAAAAYQTLNSGFRERNEWVNRSRRFDRATAAGLPPKKSGAVPCHQPSGALGGFLLAALVEFACPLACLFRSLSPNLIKVFSFFFLEASPCWKCA